MEMPELKTLLANSPNVTTAAFATSTKSSLTTHVTLNMRKCRRRSSDVGTIAQHQQATNFVNDGVTVQRMADVRHSICGSPLPIANPSNAIETTSGRRLEQISGEKLTNTASAMMLSNDQLHTSVSSVLTGIFNRKVQ